MLRFLLAAACLITAAAVPAQNGVAGTGRWAEGPGGQGAFFREGDRLGIRAQGEDNFVWRSPEVKILPGKAYRFRFRAKGEGSGLVVSGLPQANHDFNTPADWQTFSFAFRAPESGDPYMRIGEWHARGSLLFEKPEMYPVKTAHRQWGSLTLGEGESLQKGQYTDRHPLGWAGTTVHRSLYRQNTYFNTNRWSFGPSGEVVYRHQLPFEMKSGKVTVNINLYGAGALTVSASRDGQNWTEAARLSRMGDGEAALPASLFPAKEIYVRLQAEGGDANIQADQYAFQAAVDYAGPARRGETALIEERLSSGDVDLSWNPETRRWALRWQNRYPSARPLAISLAVNGKPVSVIRKTAAGGKAISAAFPAPALPVGQYSIEVTVASGQQTLHTSQVDIRQTVIGESDYGYPLASGNKSLSAWWCEGAWKVGRDRGVPTGKASQAVRIEAARGEYEPAQVVLNARQQGIVLTGAQVSDLVGKGGRIPARQVALHEVATVTVEHPSDSLGDAGEYPDPLPLLKTPLALPARRNQALWVLVHVPGSAAAGDYRGTLTLCTNRGNLDIPLQVHVFDFAIPKETHLRSGFGADNGGIKTYYKLDTPEQERRMWDLYMKSFADLRQDSGRVRGVQGRRPELRAADGRLPAPARKPPQRERLAR